jgi:8-oxo-dGTP diphosphatase
MDFSGAMIENKEGKFLFQLRDNKPEIYAPGTWGIFGGGIEVEETPKEAALRELKEELDLNVREKDLEFIKEVEFAKSKGFIFHVKTDKKISDLRLNEGQDMKYFSMEEILFLDNLMPSVRNFLENNQKLFRQKPSKL